MKKAMVLDIQRYSVHDGPGIRTTVFLKGCHMACAWCHNPESQKSRPEMMFYQRNCIHCGECAAWCRKGAVQGGKGARNVEVSVCAECDQMTECALRCPGQALRVCGREMTVEEVMRQVRKDKAFYGGPQDPFQQRGGITCSGGEPLLQDEFAEELLQVCRQEGIGTCVDTTLNVPWETVEHLIPVTDLFLVDVKLMDRDISLKYTGTDGQLTLENLKRLAERKKPVVIRTPLVPGINDTPEETAARERFLAGLNNILRWDRFYVTDHGRNKYAALGRKDWLAEYLRSQKQCWEREV